MGGMSAMNSISRVLDKHGNELKKEYMEMVPESIRDQVTGVGLGNKTYAIETAWLLRDGGELPGPEIDIDTLAERFPDCEVGY